MRILITAGPTREYWDDVRFLTSGATGRLGMEIARAAADAGHESVLVLGPTHLTPPAHSAIRVEHVVSARDLLGACLEHWPTCHALVATAAVADFRPAERHVGKRSKTGDDTMLRLERNPDVLATLAADKGDRRILGFALQVEDGEHLAREKLVAKHLDGIVLDGPEALGVGVADFRLLLPDGSAREFPATSKVELARHVVAFLAGCD